MIRYQKYIVIKLSDLDKHTSENDKSNLHLIMTKIHAGRVLENKDPTPDFVCIKDSWPEYELVWSMLEKRVDNEDTVYS